MGKIEPEHVCPGLQQGLDSLFICAGGAERGYDFGLAVMMGHGDFFEKKAVCKDIRKGNHTRIRQICQLGA